MGISSTYERLGRLPLQQVLDALRAGHTRLSVLGVTVRLTGVRLATFAAADILCCSDPTCQRRATHFAVERHKVRPGHHSRAFHLNLYGLDRQGNEVLFTYDHTVARALGGADHLKNTTPMCRPCNARKGRLEQALVEHLRTGGTLESLETLWTQVTRPRPPSPQRLARQHALIARLAHQRSMTPETFLTWCNTEGHPWSERWISVRQEALLLELGLTRGGWHRLRQEAMSDKGKEHWSGPCTPQAPSVHQEGVQDDREEAETLLRGRRSSLLSPA